MSYKILIVDDMKSFLDLEKVFLKRAECKVFSAKNGLEAIRIAKSEKPHIVMLDLEMPVMNGIECTRMIRSDVELKDTPIVIVTSSHKKDECFKAGASAYLLKPVDEDVFISEIKKFLPIIERKDRRVDMTLPVAVDFKSTKSKGAMQNISRSGLLLVTDEPFAVGTRLTVDFKLPSPNKRIKLKAMVARESKDTYGRDAFGLRFEDVPADELAALDSFIEKHCAA